MWINRRQLVSLLVVFCTLLINSTQCAKILGLFTIPARSQHVLGSALLKGLAAKGHDVTLVSAYCSDAKQNIKNYREICVTSLVDFKETQMKFMTDQNTTLLMKISSILGALEKMTRCLLDNEELQKLANSNTKFDVTIHNMMFNEALLPISHRLNSTVIGFSSVGTNPWINYHTGVPAPYSYVPQIFLPFSDEMSFLQRTANVFTSILFDLMFHYIAMPTQRKLQREYFPDSPSMDSLLEDVDLYFLNSHFSTETPRPLLNNMMQVGGYHLDEVEELPKDIKQFLDSAKNGVIFFSLGSNFQGIDLLTPEMLQSIIVAFKKSKYNVLWKFERDIENLPKNIKISSWLPQRAILNHPNVKIFITHSGLGSTVESVYMGVPMICMPIFGDQSSNARDTVSKGNGIMLDYKTLTEESLTKAINEISENPVYRKNVQMRSDIYKNQINKPIDRINFWIEHVIRHKGAKHLKAKVTRLSFYQYYLLDVIAFSVVVFSTVIYLVYFVNKKIFQFICRLFAKKPVNPTKNKNKVKKN